MTSYVLEVYENDKPLLPTTEIKADGTPDNHGAGGWDGTPVRMTQIGSYGGMQVFKSENAADKFVTVTNTGKTDAYVRTLVAVEIGTADEDLVGTSYHSNWEKNLVGKVAIDNNNYIVTEYVYKGASDGTRHVKGILPAGDTTYPSLSQVYLASVADNDDMVKLDGNENGKLDILVLSQAIHADGFVDAATALKAGFGEANEANVAEWFKGWAQWGKEEIGTPGDKWPSNDVPSVEQTPVENATDLKEALAEGKTNFVLPAGDFVIPAEVAGKTVTFTGAGDETVVDFTKAANVGGANITFENMTFIGKDANVMNGYGIHGTDGDIVYKNCTFDRTDSRAILVYSHGNNPVKVLVEDCTFKAEAKGYTSVPAWTAAIEVDTTNISSAGTTVTINNCTYDGNYNGIVRDKSAAGKANAVITIDGVAYTQN